MADKSPIEWTDATANVVNGCSLASPGCTNCYAMKQAHRTDVRRGLTTMTSGGMVWNGDVRFHEPALQQVLRWKRPRRIFWNAHGDLFHPKVPDSWIERCFEVMRQTPDHIHQVLTKRSARMREFVTDYTRLPDAICAFYDLPTDGSCKLYQPLRNVWLGVSVEDQQRAADRVPDLLATPSAIRWLSCEPLIGPLNLRRIRVTPNHHTILDALGGYSLSERGRSKLDWVVVGGESGPAARPMHPDWARSLRDQCEAAEVPFFFKQWGEWRDRGAEQPIAVRKFSSHIGYVDVDTGQRKPHPNRFSDETMIRLGKKVSGRLLDGIEHSAVPA